MFSVIVRRSTRTIRSTTGISQISPGPFGCGNSRPSRKPIARPYSRKTLIALIAYSTSKKRTTPRATRAALNWCRLRSCVDPTHVEGQIVEARDPDPVARVQRVVGVGPPELAPDEDLALTARDAL